MNSIRVEVQGDDCQRFARLDQFLCQKTNLGRSFLKKLFQRDCVVLNEDSLHRELDLKLKKMPPVGVVIDILVPPPPPSKIVPQDLPLDILYQDDHLLFVNKTPGMVTHPAPGHREGTLANALHHHCPDLQGPGIVHRLDKGTSGVMVMAKTLQCHEKLSILFGQHNIQRTYLGLVMGCKLPPQGTLQSSIGRDPRNRLKMAANVVRGRMAITHYKVLEYFQRASLVELTLETGRTHQIRVQLSSLLKTPIMGDALYGHPPEQLQRLDASVAKILKDSPHPLLHAQKLGLTHPITGKKLLLSVPPPDLFGDVLNALRKHP